jgi:hypothetical protein
MDKPAAEEPWGSTQRFRERLLRKDERAMKKGDASSWGRRKNTWKARKPKRARDPSRVINPLGREGYGWLVGENR